MDSIIPIPVFVDAESAISFGLLLREKADGLNWLLGEFAIRVETDLGTGALEQVSKSIGVQLATIRRYRDVSKRFNSEIRQKYPRLSWSHFKEVAYQENPELLLEQADNESWSVEMTRAKLKLPAVSIDTIAPRLIQCTCCKKFFLVGSNICDKNGEH